MLFKRLISDSAKVAANVAKTIPESTGATAGNSFKSFKEYRKSAVLFGPAKSSPFKTNTKIEQIFTEENDYGVSKSFAESAKNSAYGEK